MARLRGADILARSLARAGVRRIFTVSGNHVMALFDASIEAKLELVHTRHEAAAVHMADAWARMTGEVGVAVVTGGPGHANAVAALYTALAAEAPVVLVSGHAPIGELGRGAFQELRQADMAAPACKWTWTSTTAASIGDDLARAVRMAREGRPGAVHLSVPTDALDAFVVGAEWLVPHPDAFAPPGMPLGSAAADAVLREIRAARRPLLLVGPHLMRGAGLAAARRLERAIAAPVVGMESPRGLNDPSLGAFPEVLTEADLVVLLGRQLDFTLGYGRVFDVACRFVHVDPDLDALQRTSRAVGERAVLSTIADSSAAAEQLAAEAEKAACSESAWVEDVRAAIAYRPADWSEIRSGPDDKPHPLEVCRAVQRVLDAHPDAVHVADGGEFGQWAQASLTARKRITNGPAGAIGGGLPYAAAAKLASPDALVVATMGDGSFGFHPAEIDTAVRYALPFVAIVGNDARWNAEYQIQLRHYGASRAVGCDLLPSRYDLVAAGFGGHGELVTRAGELPGALERAVRSGRPACINVLVEGRAAPDLRRTR